MLLLIKVVKTFIGERDVPAISSKISHVPRFRLATLTSTGPHAVVNTNLQNKGYTTFSIERDVKNQGKTTIKVNIKVGKEIIGKIDMPEHKSAMRVLDRGRLLFYVTFKGGRGYLDNDILMRDIINA